MGVVYYKQNKNILEPHLSWDEMRLVYVSFNDRQETLTPTAVHCHEKNLELQYICGAAATCGSAAASMRCRKVTCSSTIRASSTTRAPTRSRGSGSTTAA